MKRTAYSKHLRTWVIALGICIGGSPVLGQAHEQEEVIAESAVPKPVLAAVKKKYPGGSVLKYEREVEAGKTVYEAKLKWGERQLDAKYTPEGVLVEEEEILREADLPPAVRAAFAKSAHGKAAIEQIERVTKAGQNTPPIYEIEVRIDGKKIELLYDASGAFLGQE